MFYSLPVSARVAHMQVNAHACGRALLKLALQRCSKSGMWHGFLIRVPCDTKAVIHHEYGEDSWMTPNPQYNFHRDSKNFRDNGTWTAAEWGKDGNGEVYAVYNSDGKQLTGKSEKRSKMKKKRKGKGRVSTSNNLTILDVKN